MYSVLWGLFKDMKARQKGVVCCALLTFKIGRGCRQAPTILIPSLARRLFILSRTPFALCSMKTVVLVMGQ